MRQFIQEVYIMYNNFYPMNNYQQPNRYEVIHVNGENGARALAMLPNSNALLLDDTAPIVWLAMTDGAGYKTVTAYDIAPHHPKQEVNIDDVIRRLEVLEAKLNDESNNADDQ